MFDGVPDQLHQFIASSRTSIIPLPLSFSPSSSSSPLSLHHHHGSSANTASIFTSFDPFSTSSQQVSSLQVQPHHFLHSLPPQAQKTEGKEGNRSSSGSLVVGMNLEIERERSSNIPEDPTWSNDELLAPLKIRSSLENWFPELTWEQVSRKLEELGYKRSAEKCKQNFEEESRSFNNINYNKNYRAFFSEFDDDVEEELYNGQNPQKVAEDQNKKMEQPREEEDKTREENLEEDTRNDQTVGITPCEDQVKSSKGYYKKRKREKNFEMFKGMCEDIVKKMMAQQEEMHNKLLEDMVKRDETKVAREEAWKKQEMDKINKELEIRAYEQAIAGDRQAILIKFLTKFTSSSSSTSSENQSFGGRNEEGSVVRDKAVSTANPTSSSSLIPAQNPNPICHQANKQNINVEVPSSSTMIPADHNSASCPTQNSPINSTSLSKNLAPQNPSSNLGGTTTPKIPTSSAVPLAPQNPNSPNTQNKQPLAPTSSPIQNAPQKLVSSNKEDIGKRWPRDEVLALINLRCNLHNNGDDREGAARTPLWERISQGMLELGYKRSAKRCKEKWENINKYFRKTKDTNKKRSLDSRTCPYFHQLSTFYSQGRLLPPSEGTENRSALLKNNPTLSENHHGSSSTDSTMYVAQGEKHSVPVPAAFDFEF